MAAAYTQERMHTNSAIALSGYKATRLLEGASNNTGRGTLSGGLMGNKRYSVMDNHNNFHKFFTVVA